LLTGALVSLPAEAAAPPDRSLPLGAVARVGSLHFRHLQKIYALAFAPDGKALATASFDETVRLWDVASGKELRRFRGHTGYIAGVGFLPDGEGLVSAGWDKTIRFWDVETGKETSRINCPTNVVALAVCPRGRFLAVGGNDHTVRLYKVTTGRQVHLLEGHEDAVTRLSFSPDGKYLVSGVERRSGPARLWDVETGREVRRIEKRNPRLVQAMKVFAFVPGGKDLATWDEGQLIFRSIASGKVNHRLNVGGTIESVAFSPDGRRVAVGRSPSTLLLDARTGEHLHDLARREEGSLVAFSPDGKILAEAAGTGVDLWDGATGAKLPQSAGPARKAYRLRFSPDGKRLAAIEENNVRVWDAATGKEQRCFHARGADRVSDIAFRPNGKELAAATSNRRVVLWDVNTGALTRQFDRQEVGTFPLAFAPDGKSLVVGCLERSLRMLSADTAVGGKGVIRILDTVTGKELRRLHGHDGEVGALAFSPDGKLLASAGADATVLIWSVPPARPRGGAHR
jgi:WD40 repeat protein